jgi:ABC-type dipeptide/oligopeptide/nickel transport system ATPase subunit
MQFELPPKKRGDQRERFENVRAMVIIGANGCGKSRMGAMIEQLAGANAHRLSAQRALSIPSYVQPRTYEQAECTLLYGAYNPSQNPAQHAAEKFGRRWGDEPAGRLIGDFEHVMALLFADEAKRNRDYSRAALATIPTGKPPTCKLDMLSEIWKSVMPQRTLNILDDKIDAQTTTGQKYEARQMSDGERVTLYLLGQALCALPNAVVIIDEPEIHLHRAIQSLLWDKVEAARPDCTFIYITHDLDFAATRTGARKIWIKEFDGTDWAWEEVPPGPLPDALLFQVLGSRRPLLFVEGDETSYDAAIYTALYPTELVVPRQTCEKVVEATKSMIGLRSIHNLNVRGIVDRDRRGDDEINALRGNSIFVADVAEIESLLCLPEALEAVAKQLNAEDVNAATSRAKDAVIAEFKKVVDQQALAHALAEIQFQLNGFGPKIGNSSPARLEADLKVYVSSIDVGVTIGKYRKLMSDAVTDYRATLKLYNCKGIISFVASSFGIKKDVYCQIVLSGIKTSPDGAIAVAMRSAIGAVRG